MAFSDTIEYPSEVRVRIHQEETGRIILSVQGRFKSGMREVRVVNRAHGPKAADLLEHMVVDERVGAARRSRLIDPQQLLKIRDLTGEEDSF